jgi:hypothetical protein
MYIVYIGFPLDRRLINKSYILDILDIYHVHPFYYNQISGDSSMITDAFTSISATIGGGFFGGVLLGYALKKETLATTNLGIPLTGGMSAGFAVGFMKG